MLRIDAMNGTVKPNQKNKYLFCYFSQKQSFFIFEVARNDALHSCNSFLDRLQNRWKEKTCCEEGFFAINKHKKIKCSFLSLPKQRGDWKQKPQKEK